MDEYKVYETARFFVEEGMYSIGELEELVRQFKEAKKMQDAALRRSMGIQGGN